MTDITPKQLAHAVEAELTEAERLLDGDGDRQYILEALIQRVRALVTPHLEQPRVKVILFKPSGKYYTEEEWRIPATVPDHSPQRGPFTRKVIGPYDMRHSPDFRRIPGGPVLIPEQEPWGYPHLFPAE